MRICAIAKHLWRTRAPPMRLTPYRQAGASKYDVLDTTNIDGVEARTMDYNEAGIKITPFNLEEEEEGHFDKDGNFVWDKEQEGGDAWLESVDWCVSVCVCVCA